MLSLLGNYGIKPVVADDGRQASKMVELKEFDLVLMDCQMPEMDGFEATEKIRAFEHDAKREPVNIVALTANAMKGDRERCLAVGMNDYLSKPVKELELEDMLRKWLSARKVSEKAVALVPVNDRVGAPQIIDEGTLSKLRTATGEKFTSLIALFLSNGDKLMNDIGEGLETGNPDAVKRATHALRSTTGQMGALNLQNIVMQIDEHAKNESLEDVPALYAEAQAQWRQVQAFFDKE